MKILHTADWHLGKRLEKFSRIDEQREVLEEIIQIAEDNDVDAVLIAGDLFDNFNPSTEAVELFYRSLKRLSNNGKRVVVAIAGNHDSPDRIEAPDSLARECGILFAGYPDSTIAVGELECGISILQSEPGFLELKLPEHEAALRIIITPYANEYRLKTFLGIEETDRELRNVLETRWKELADRYCDNKGVNILLTHLFMMKKGSTPPEEPEDEKPILHVGGAQAIYSENVPQQIQYVALGHLHRYQVIDNKPCPLVYCSSPLSYSFAEAEQQKFVVILDIEPAKEVQYSKIPLTKGKKLQRKRFEDIDVAVNWLQENADSLVELTMVTDQYMRSDDRKRLLQAHSGIVTLIPELVNLGALESHAQSLDLNQSIEDLFKQYFQHRHGVEVNDELFDLFKEIKAEQNEE
ncbi:metallophosphoesterase family protein [Albibacterium bauzanense]|uniref:Nuclease SbcCD subunit D n=1 Tax=Albibacterium bauzanense TaxID=653929 RepID=A0A4R1LXB9_9SPHI|nr:exonuclease subunit SbcD [Albibacterium bauzanense]TCK83134.1 exodeoxyribonuclease I subunit D [Albibacterium bauzanense]